MEKSQEEFIEEVIAKSLKDAGYHVTNRFSTDDSAPSAHGVAFTGLLGDWSLTLEKKKL